MPRPAASLAGDRKSTRLNSSHRCISYAVFCLKKKERVSWLGVALGVLDAALRAPAVWPSVILLHVALLSSAVPPLTVAVICFFFLMIGGPPRFSLFPYTPLFR